MGDLVQAACRLATLLADWVKAAPAEVVVLCTPGAAQSAERSCAERASSAQLQQVALPGAEHLVLLEQQVVLKR